VLAIAPVSRNHDGQRADADFHRARVALGVTSAARVEPQAIATACVHGINTVARTDHTTPADGHRQDPSSAGGGFTAVPSCRARRQASCVGLAGILGLVEMGRGEELVSGKEIAELLGWVSAGAAWQQFQHGTFPAPVRLERPRLWRRADVEEWARRSPRRPSRRGSPGTLDT
jgi:predicted DNA-binding transcriptional regulator AlpA